MSKSLSMRLSMAIAVIVLLGGCVSPIIVSLEDVGDDFLNDQVFLIEEFDRQDAQTAEVLKDDEAGKLVLHLKDDQKLLRSGYILSGFALYGVHSVRRYSDDAQVDDAMAIINRLKLMVKSLQARQEKDKDNPSFWYSDYVLESFGFIKVTTYPTKRYFRDRWVQAFITQNPIAIASSLRNALKGLAEVTWYQRAIKTDATNVLKGIISNGSPDLVTSDWSGVNELIKTACTRLAYLAEQKPEDQCKEGDIKVTVPG